MDETHLAIDSKTPAHIFAYKALRGIFYDSPETSPVRYSHDDKENTPIPYRASRFTTSPTKTKRKNMNELVGAAPSLTPKRQKIVQVSPVKSCMKPQGGRTPKREATVTFKDLRLSLSPELARSVSIQQPDFSVVRVTTTTGPETAAPEAKMGKKETPVETTKSANVAAAVYNEVLDAYKTQTEKEIRRLLKYGQKWKEQAKRFESDVKKLEEMVQELRQQNLSLEKRIKESERSERLDGQAIGGIALEKRDRRKERDDRSSGQDILAKPRTLVEKEYGDFKTKLGEKRKAVYQPDPEEREFHVRPVEEHATLDLEAKIERAYGAALQGRQSINSSNRADKKERWEDVLSEEELPRAVSPPMRVQAPSVRKRAAHNSPSRAKRLSREIKASDLSSLRMKNKPSVHESKSARLAPTVSSPGQPHELSDSELPISDTPLAAAAKTETRNLELPKRSFNFSRPSPGHARKLSFDPEISKPPAASAALVRASSMIAPRSASSPAVPDDVEQRRAAARIRLALRRADRLASAPVESTTPKAVVPKRDAVKSIESEESQLDWAGL